MMIDKDQFQLYILSKHFMVRYAAIFACIGLVTILWLRLIYNPLRNAIEICNQEKVRLQQKYTHSLNTINDMETMDQKCKKLSADLDSLWTSNIGLQDFISLLINATNMHMLQLISCTPEKTEEKKWYYKQRVSFIIKGSFDHLISFFKQFEQQPLLWQCNQMSVEKQDQDLLMSCCIDYVFKKS